MDAWHSKVLTVNEHAAISRPVSLPQVSFQRTRRRCSKSRSTRSCSQPGPHRRRTVIRHLKHVDLSKVRIDPMFEVQASIATRQAQGGPQLDGPSTRFRNETSPVLTNKPYPQFLNIVFIAKCPPIFGGHLMHQSTQQQNVPRNSRLRSFYHSYAIKLVDMLRSKHWLRKSGSIETALQLDRQESSEFWNPESAIQNASHRINQRDGESASGSVAGQRPSSINFLTTFGKSLRTADTATEPASLGFTARTT